MELCIGIQAALACLAILSRIHFSKYKDGDIKGLKHIREEVQALRVLTRREAQTLVRTRVKQLVWTTIAILFASTCIAEGLLFKSMQQSKRLDTQVVKRTNYDGKVKTEDIRLSVDDKEYTYTMEIEPREYTEEEFYQQAQQRITELESEILGDNPDLEHVSRSLNLPGEDATGVFTYAWRSDNPAVLSSYGKVDLEEVTETVIVLLTVEVSYRTYTIEHSFPVSVVKDMRRKDAIERVEDALFQLEQETRTDEALVLPEQLGEVGISLQKQEHGQAMTWVIFGIVLAAALPVWLYAKWKEERKKRNNVLMEQYPSFVNRLWLLLGSGMTVQTGIRQILSEMEKDWLLRRELEYAMHQLDTGSEESWVYEQLGRRLELPEYYQLLQHISQHIRMGTKDLRNLMEQEMQQVLEKRRELAQKKGEEASTKLLFPMILLLVLVMVMIVYPAWVGL